MQGRLSMDAGQHWRARRLQYLFCNGRKEGSDKGLVNVIKSLKLVEIDLIGALAAKQGEDGCLASSCGFKEGRGWSTRDFGRTDALLEENGVGLEVCC